MKLLPSDLRGSLDQYISIFLTQCNELGFQYVQVPVLRVWSKDRPSAIDATRVSYEGRIHSDA